MGSLRRATGYMLQVIWSHENVVILKEYNILLKLWKVWTQESFHKYVEHDYQEIVVSNRTVVDSDWCFSNLCHFQSQSELYYVSWWYYKIYEVNVQYSFLVLFFIMSFLCLIAAAFLKDRKPWIVKPVASSRGRGIYLVSHVSSLIKCFSGNNCYSNGLICILTISDSLSATWPLSSDL